MIMPLKNCYLIINYYGQLMNYFQRNLFICNLKRIFRLVRYLWLYFLKEKEDFKQTLFTNYVSFNKQ